jgi:hypothetical protein
VILNPELFSDTTGGTFVGKPATNTDGSTCPKSMAVAETAELQWIYPGSAGGNQSTYIPDRWIFDYSCPCLSVGATFAAIDIYGLFYSKSQKKSDTLNYIGCRLMVLPGQAA